MTALFLVLALVQGPTPAAADPLDVTTLRPSRGPEVLFHPQAGPLVALRLAAPGVDLPEGSLELLQELARPAARDAAEQIGARLRFRSEDRTAIIAVTGPASAFDAMATLLRAASADLDLSVTALRAARARAEDRVLAALEQPEPRLRRLLWHRLFGGPAPTGATATLLDPEDVRRARQRLYDPARIRITVVGDLPPEVILSAFSLWPSDDSTPGPLEPDSLPEAPRPPTHREWAGLGYPVQADPAPLATAATLVQRRLDAAGLQHATARAWHGPTGRALVLVGATEPGDTSVASAAVGGVGGVLRRAIAEATALAGAGAVTDARASVRRALLLEARTTSGRAEVIGRLADALERADGAAWLLAALDTVTVAAVHDVLERTLASPARYVETP